MNQSPPSARCERQGMQRAIHGAIAGLTTTRPQIGLTISLVNIIGLNFLVFMTFSAENWWLWLALTILTGLFYCSVLMTTHDAIHHTLTGWYWFDEIVPRLLSWFVFWPHGLYAELHRRHHRLNGRDPREPEQPTPLRSDYENAGSLTRWRLRNQWWLALFVYGGFGMIIRHLAIGIRLWPDQAEIRRQMLVDAVGIMCAFVVTLAVITHLEITWRYLAYLLVVERIVGFFQQLRSHIEHYGLHQPQCSLLETRLYNCRNIKTTWLASRFFNGLNFHSVHHAFPAIPFYNLRTAHERVAALCREADVPLLEGEGYGRSLMQLARTPLLIDDDEQGVRKVKW